MDYTALTELEYARYSNGISNDTKVELKQLGEVVKLQNEAINLISSSLNNIHSTMLEGNKAVIDRLNKPKTVIRDTNGKIKGVV